MSIAAKTEAETKHTYVAIYEGVVVGLPGDYTPGHGWLHPVVVTDLDGAEYAVVEGSATIGDRIRPCVRWDDRRYIGPCRVVEVA